VLEMFHEISDRYRQSYLAADIKQAKLGILLLTIPLVLFFYNDYLFFSLSFEFYFLTAVRLGLLVYTVLFFLYLGRLKKSQQYYRSTFAWGLAGIAFQLLINSSRPESFLFHVIMVIILTFANCLVIPQTFVNRVILSLTLTIGELTIIVLGMPSVAVTALFSVVFSLILANIIGLSMSRLMESYRLKTFEAQAESARLATFPTLNPNPVIEADLAGNVTYLNSAAEAAFPDLKKAGLNHPFFSGWEQVVNAFKDEKKQTFDRDVKVGDTWLYQQVHVVPVTRMVRIYVADTTAAKVAEETLRQTKEYLDNLLNYANAPIIVWDNEKSITLFNNAFAAFTGYNKESMLRENIEMLFPASHKTMILKNIEKASLGEKWKSIEVPILCKDGKTRIALWNSANVMDKEGNIVATIAQGQDITERKEVEEKLSETMDRLVLVNEKLGVVGSLTRHDVGNKLMVVKSNLYLLKKQIGDNPKLAKYFEGIDSALILAAKIFEYSRLYERIGSEKPSKENVFECFNQAVALLPNLGTAIKILNDCHGLEVTADSLLKQLFYNFLDNSLKHGEKIAQIHLHYTNEGDELKLFYEDDGVGVPEANKSKLFGSGFTTGNGSGLGLYLIKKMIDIYGWTITEDGEADKGAKFVITIPKHNKNGKENYQIVP
jgi:PAS domain S-box-containing protein